MVNIPLKSLYLLQDWQEQAHSHPANTPQGREHSKTAPLQTARKRAL